jgi:type III restriction enzyme
MKLIDFQLLPFQQEVVDKAVEAIYSYNASKNLFTIGSNIPSSLEGKEKPYLHRIKAITGAGKTPILAAISARLKNSIILWTTPRGAVIEQTTENLKGKYRNLLGDDTEVLGLDEALRNAAWNRIIEKTSGCTLITTTVAAFNQKESKNLTIHKGDPSPWQQLCDEVKRPIWVFYDEGHNATENQFKRLLELQPKGFILASASPLAADLQILLPGEDKQAKERVLNDSRTTTVNTKLVVAAGLLKLRIISVHILRL